MQKGYHKLTKVIKADKHVKGAVQTARKLEQVNVDGINRLTGNGYFSVWVVLVVPLVCTQESRRETYLYLGGLMGGSDRGQPDMRKNFLIEEEEDGESGGAASLTEGS